MDSVFTDYRINTPTLSSNFPMRLAYLLLPTWQGNIQLAEAIYNPKNFLHFFAILRGD